MKRRMEVAMTDKMMMERMEFFGYHGVLQEENKLGQRYYVDLTLFLDLSSAGRNDRLTDTVDYVSVYETVKAIVEGKAVQLIETLAETIAAQLLEIYTKIDAVQVKVTKPHPPVGIHFSGVSVEVYRERRMS